MPTMDRLAANGLTYSQWHTTALCSPTRSVFLTGRNHHQNGFASISETSTGFPGYNSHIPRRGRLHTRRPRGDRRPGLALRRLLAVRDRGEADLRLQLPRDPAGMGEHHEAHGPVRLYVDDEVVAEAQIRGMASRYSLCGEGLCVGYDGGDAVSREYTSTFPFDGGTIVKVVIEVGDDAYLDLESHMAAAMARD
jgi:Sulfatase